MIVRQSLWLADTTCRGVSAVCRLTVGETAEAVEEAGWHRSERSGDAFSRRHILAVELSKVCGERGSLLFLVPW